MVSSRFLRNLRTPRYTYRLRSLALLLAVGLSPLLGLRSAHAATNSITRPDAAFEVGAYLSLALDANGFPVVSYLDDTTDDLKLLHCNDANCAGNNESITRPDSAGSVGSHTSLSLDANGFPVVSYQGNGTLKVLHCNDANCAGDNESITSPDPAGNGGEYTSLMLDRNGYPVVSYHGNGTLKVLRCNDANCAGNNESITSPDTAGNVGWDTSLALDANGFPVISYYDVTNQTLKVLHCNDANCAGNNESITRPDTAGNVGRYTSLVLDANGFPAVSYYDAANQRLKVLHCNDVNCAGNNESITRPDLDANGGEYTSLALAANGFPVVSYKTLPGATPFHLRVLHCNDANCAGNNESIASPDTLYFSGFFSSLALDVNGFPVVGYMDGMTTDLKLLHCSTATCSPDSTPPVIKVQVIGAMGNNNWYVNNVTVKFTCADEAGGSGIATNTLADATLTTEGTNQSVTNPGTCTDRSGNVATPVTVSGFNLDKSKPLVTVTGVSNGAVYPPGSVPTAGCVATDNVSGMATQATLAVTGGNGDGTGSFTATCSGATDKAGNMAAPVSVSYIVAAPTDSTAPVITPQIDGILGNNGWYVSDVIVSWSVVDSESAISHQNGCDPVGVTTDTGGATFTCSATSLGGSSSQSVTIQRDATAPTLAPTVSPNPVTQGTAATATANATDALAGIASQSCDTLDTSTVGSKSVTCTATDNAGNTASVSVNYTVQAAGVVVGVCGGYEVRQIGNTYTAAGWGGAIKVGTNSANTINGTADRDLILGLGGNDKLDGKGGDDVLCGGDGVDLLTGLAGNDYLDGGNGNDVLNGGTGDHDQLLGGEGNDVLLDGDGVINAQGGPGNDLFTLALRNGWRDSNGQTLFAGRLAAGYGNDTVILVILDRNPFFVDLTGDERDNPASPLEGNRDRLGLLGKLSPAPVKIKFEAQLVISAEADAQVSEDAGAEYLTEPVGDDSETVAQPIRIFLPVINR